MTDKAAGEKLTAHSRLASLAEAVGATKSRGPAPVHLWNPPYCGDIDMRIAADGTWFYDGTPITRPAMVSLFAGILRKDPERYVLVTPVERVGIRVDDAPFVAVAMCEDAGVLRFVSNVGDEVEVGCDHALRFTLTSDDGVKPYVHIRGDLWARLTRSLAIDLLGTCTEEVIGDSATIGIRSGGRFFRIDGPTPLKRVTM
jgi:Uncharacterized protein conserved in bacteria